MVRPAVTVILAKPKIIGAIKDASERMVDEGDPNPRP
jgi:hypothetical protein